MRHFVRIAAVLFITAMINFLTPPAHAQGAPLPPGTTLHTITWKAAATTEPVTYNVYQLVSGAWVKIKANVSALSVEVQVTPGLQQYQIAAVTEDGRESAKRSPIVTIRGVGAKPPAPTVVSAK